MHARCVRHRPLRRGFELLHLGQCALPHAVLMMIPEAWENHADMSPARRAFTATARPSWSRGTAPRRSCSPTAPSWAPCSTATARPAAAGCATTASS
ncbi:MAG: hypothetical protein U0Q22_07885 [Acidimicrobiales bacterium]